MNPLAIAGPHHAGLVVSNLERSLAWYATHLGFQVKSRTDLPDEDLVIVYIERDGFELELFAKSNTELQRPAERDVMNSFQYQGWRHFCFRVGDVDAVWAECSARGLDLALPPSENPVAKVKYCFVRDPDGILIEFLQPLA
jgi:glyoxylase I family protein